MGLGLVYTFDPFLPCNSHHVRRPQAPTVNLHAAPHQQQQATQNQANNGQSQTGNERFSNRKSSM